MNSMFKNIAEIVGSWIVNLLTIVVTSQQLSGQLNLLEQFLKIVLLVITIIYTYKKIKSLRKNSKHKSDD